LIYTDSESCASFAKMLGELPRRLRVVLADLGESRPASSAHRGPGLRLDRLPDDWEMGARRGLGARLPDDLRRTDESPTTLRYRAPEVCLGDWEYGAGVDTWSYGCVLAELVNKEPLLRGQTEYEMLLAIFQRFGTPGPDSELARLPLFQQKFPVFARAGVWPGHLRDRGDTDLLDLLGQLLLVEPSRRWSAETALASPYCRRPPLEMQFGAAPAERGVLSVVQGQLDPRTLHWLQADPCWHGAAGLVGARKKDKSMTEKEHGVKHEEGGFTRASRPSTVWCNRLDCSKPSRAGRVVAFTRALSTPTGLG
jgi:serine/threonine protein kinase